MFFLGSGLGVKLESGCSFPGPLPYTAQVSSSPLPFPAPRPLCSAEDAAPPVGHTLTCHLPICIGSALGLSSGTSSHLCHTQNLPGHPPGCMPITEGHMGKAAAQYCPTKPHRYKDPDFNCRKLWSTSQCSATARPWGCNVHEGKHNAQGAASG